MSAYKHARHPHHPDQWVVRSTLKATIASVHPTKDSAIAEARRLNAVSPNRSRVGAGKRPKW